MYVSFDLLHAKWTGRVCCNIDTGGLKVLTGNHCPISVVQICKLQTEMLIARFTGCLLTREL